MKRISRVSSSFSVGIHPSGGFVEQEQLGLRGQRAHDLQPPLITIRQALARGIAVNAEMKNLQQFHHLPVHLGLFAVKRGRAEKRVRHAVLEPQVERRAHVVEHAQRRKESDILKRARDAAPGDPVRTQPGNGFLIEIDDFPSSVGKHR